MRTVLACVVALTSLGWGGVLRAADPAVEALAKEVATKGWIAYSARSEKGDWEIFLCRPDGSNVRNLTNTPETNEAYPLFSRDGSKLLFRRIKKNENYDGNNYGAQGELVIADSDGTHAAAFGAEGEYPWASFSPDGKQIATLAVKGIQLVDVATKKVVKTLPRQGFFQQMTWSPDGKSLSGVSNGFGTQWSVARMVIETGKANSVSVNDCCTPDWSPDGRLIVYAKKPKDWTQMWLAEPTGANARLLYAEDGRHVYGGHLSPDGKYALFTGNMKEDGDPGDSGAAMNLMRVADAPLIGKDDSGLKKLHAEAKSGPLLSLPKGFEPCWTASELPGGKSGATGGALPSALAKGLHDAGWIVFSAKSSAGDYDLFRCRPDGTDRQAVTSTAEFNEGGVRVSPDGQKLLYYRMPKSEALDNNNYGTFDLVICDAAGEHAMILGNGYKWASWGPDSKQIACLDEKNIRVVDLQSRKTVRELPRKGIVQQLVWSPDGKAFCGTANGYGQYWNIVRVQASTGTANLVSDNSRYNCTPDWLSNGSDIAFARGIVPDKGGFAELWITGGDGKSLHAVYAEKDRHIYGACSSQDGKYMLLTRSTGDLGNVESARTEMAVVKLPDGTSPAEPATRVDLGAGWEPHWTRHNLGRTKP